jgi:hypothetical protein
VIGTLMSLPVLALIPAALSLLLFWRARLSIALVTGLAWLAYAPYEYAMLRRWLCTGECNIRVDLLLIYPVLLVLTIATMVAAVRWQLRRASQP